MRPALPRIARGEHTGEQRCWPCTVTNLLIVGGLAAVLVWFDRWPLAIALVAVSSLAVAVRGYVIPFTPPPVAPRLAAPLPGDPFDVSPNRGTGNPAIEPPEHGARGATIVGVDERPDPETVLETRAGKGTVDIDGDAVSLDPSLVDTWEAAMADLHSLDDDDSLLLRRSHRDARNGARLRNL